jgi:RNA recognition motif-containing protein
MMIHEGMGSFNSPFEMPHSRSNQNDFSLDDSCRNAVMNKIDSTCDSKLMSHLSRHSSGSSGSNAHPNVFVRGIPLLWSEEELVSLFEKFGKLTSLRLVRHSVTKSSLGYGFVRYANADDAQSAIMGLHGTMIGDQALQVKFADADAGPPTNSTSSGLTPCDSCYVKHVPVSIPWWISPGEDGFDTFCSSMHSSVEWLET